ncbi:O-antigen polysaccharide polymerase Wzy [Enterococcus faecium]|uniref:O-antigen polysaccharide polymerase Wzy n=1 Tax=Enterococcus faecium TaxID=1352 RepID=UPI002018EF5A|nr:O-antigen polysaccharide polymerase Wzy [Enterococcus faecium]UQR32312.1 O-antigen polysaccharide polymerase Wzy family protein [Enterococcus faecium]
MEKINNFNLKIFIIGFIWIFFILVQKVLLQIVNPNSLLMFISYETFIIFLVIIRTLISKYKTVFRILTLFIILFFIYLQGQVMLNAFNLTLNGLLSNKFSSEKLIDGILDVHLFMAMFLIGVSTIREKQNLLVNDALYINKKNNVYDLNMIITGYIFLLISLPFELYVNLRKLVFTLTYGYASLYQEISLESISSTSKILSYFFLPGCFYIFFASKRKSKNEKLSLILLIAHSFLELLIGYRASAIIPIILILYALNVKNKKTNSEYLNRKTKKTILGICILAAFIIVFIFPLVRESRNNGGLLNISLSNAFSWNNYKNLFTTIDSMGKSLQTVIYTKEIVPGMEPFRYGVSYIMNLTMIVPNIFGGTHPAEIYGSLGRWLTKIVDIDFWNFGGALGFNVVSEAYINFGYLGIIAIGFMLGRILQLTEIKVEASGKEINYASYAIVAVYLLSYPRGEFSSLVRGIFWYMLIPRIFYLLISRRKKSV